MPWWEVVALVAAGAAAGTINTVVGSGSLITFPVLLGLGYPAVAANVSNGLALVFGGLTGTWGYRRELAGQGPLLRLTLPAALAGAVGGAVLLLRLPPEAFEAIVPALIVAALVLVAAQPWLARRSARRTAAAGGGDRRPLGHRLALVGGCLVVGCYGGYFGAAQGVLLLGLLGSLLVEDLQRVNAAKNLIATGVNLIASGAFLVISPQLVNWSVVAMLASGTVVGGVLGARLGRRLPAGALRWVIIAVGSVAVIRMLG